MNVGVSFNENDDQMTWEIDSQTTAVYNTKDNQGNYVLWQGWPVSNFSKCTIVMAKRSTELKDIVTSHQ